MEWDASERLLKKRDKEFFTTVGAVVLLLLVILFILGEWFLSVVVIALSFFAYVMSTVEPEKVRHQITSRGLVVAGKKYAFSELGRFWFGYQWGQKILYVENRASFPGRLVMILGKVNDKKIKQVLIKHLTFEEPEKTWVDNASSWLSSRVPLEK